MTEILNKTSGRNRKIENWRRKAATCLAALYAGMGWLRLYNALRLHAYLIELGLWPDPIYIVISGSLIGLGFTTAAWLILSKHTCATRAARTIGWLFLVWLWADRVLLSSPDSFLNLLPISLVISLITLVWMFIILRPSYTNPENRSHER